MYITILNGNPRTENLAFEQYVKTFSELLHTRGHSATVLHLREMKIQYCIGCWGCWVKTPGKCLVADDSHSVCRACIQSELVIFASPVIMGFTSALLKKATDKLIPLVLPYVEIAHDECHHVARYDRYPVLGLLLEQDENTDDEDIAIISNIYRRMALNLKTSLRFTKLTKHSIEEAADEINAL